MYDREHDAKLRRLGTKQELITVRFEILLPEDRKEVSSIMERLQDSSFKKEMMPMFLKRYFDEVLLSTSSTREIEDPDDPSKKITESNYDGKRFVFDQDNLMMESAPTVTDILDMRQPHGPKRVLISQWAADGKSS